MAVREIIGQYVNGELILRFWAYRGEITRIEFQVDSGPVTVLESNDPDVVKIPIVREIWASLCQKIEEDCGHDLYATNW